jgi:serine/threonine-protein kinase
MARPQGTIPGEPLSSALKPAPPAGAPRDKPFTAPKHLPAGTLVDKKYAVLRVLGEGGMGVVYLARDIHTGLDVVVKAVRSELAHRDDVRARTLAEGRALAQIDHPNVVHLRAVAVEGPHLYLVMQYIEGESLDRIIARHVQQGDPLPVDEALGIFRQVAAGVGAAHGEGVIHRDLKPANVILRKKDKVAKVTDFGIALVPSDTSRPQTRGILGSLWYMSPEQVTGRRDLDHRVDVYALGIMLYQMLVGRVPFDAKSDYDIMKLHAEAPMPLASAARPDVPASVDELLQRACAKNRDARFQRCEDLIAAVERILYPAPPPTLREAPPGLTPAIPLVALPGPGAPPVPPAPTLAASSPGDTGGDPGNPGGLAATGIAPTAEDKPPVIPVRRRRAPWIVLALLVIAAGAGGAVAAAGLVPGVPGVFKIPRRPDAGAPPGSATAVRAADAGAPRPIEALAGAWVGNGRELEAVVVGGDLEFRVKRPDHFPRQGYEAGDARFVLRPTADPAVYAVEDRIRPVPPTGKAYDARARGTCQEVWAAAGSDPLRARYDGTRLSVEFAKIEPGPSNFITEGNRVTSCVALRDLRAVKVVSILTRP